MLDPNRKTWDYRETQRNASMLDPSRRAWDYVAYDHDDDKDPIELSGYSFNWWYALVIVFWVVVISFLVSRHDRHR